MDELETEGIHYGSWERGLEIRKASLRPPVIHYWPFQRGVFIVVLFISPEHEVLMVSYFGQSMSVVRRAASTIVLKAYPSYTLSQLNWYLVDSIGVTCSSKKLKSFRSEIQDGRHGRQIENLLFASSPEPKSQLTPNLLGSIGMTCRSKIAKIVPIGNPRCPPWQPSWKSIFRFFS